jgi:hypothetical protein
MSTQAILNDTENRAKEVNRGATPAEPRRFEHPAQALRRILGRERFKAEHVYGVLARRR